MTLSHTLVAPPEPVEPQPDPLPERQYPDPPVYAHAGVAGQQAVTWAVAPAVTAVPVAEHAPILAYRSGLVP